MEGLQASTVVMAFLLSLKAVEAHTCRFSQEPNPESWAANRYRWVLSQPQRDPCDCTAFRLGGVNTLASQLPAGAHFFNHLPEFLSRTPEEIRDALGCKSGADDVETYSTYTTSQGGILFPFGEFAPPLHATFEVVMADASGIARIYLAKFPRGPTEQPPYMIELHAAEVVVLKFGSDADVPIYQRVAAEIITTGATDRQFSVYCEYDTADPTTAIIKVGLGVDGEPQPRYILQYTDSTAVDVRYVGLFSTKPAEWKFLNR